MFQRRAAKTAVDHGSSPRCVMCGVGVTVDANGFCPLGHFVGAQHVSTAPVTAAPVYTSVEPARHAEPEPGAVFTEPTVALPVVDAPTEPLAVADVPDTVDDDDVEAAPWSAGADVPLYNGEPLTELHDGAVDPDGESEAQHALSELLAFTSSFGDGDTPDDGFSALDVAPDELPVAEEEAELSPTEQIAAPDDEVDDGVAARRRAAGLLGGTAFTVAALAGSLALLPTL